MRTAAFFLALFWAIPNIVFAQKNIPLQGIIVVQNSRKADNSVETVAGADVRALMAGATRSDVKGRFELVFSDVPEGNSVELFVRKSGMEVVNDKELRSASVLGRRSPLKVVMCPEGRLYDNQVKYYQIAESEINKRYKERVRALEREGRDKSAAIAQLEKEFSAKFNSAEEARKALEEQKNTALSKANELAQQFARVNLDDAGELYRKAFDLFQKGEVQQALDFLKQARLPELVDKILEEERRLGNVRRNLEERSEKLAETRKEAKEALDLQADLYESLFKFDSMELSLALLVRVDSTDAENLGRYAYILNQQRLYGKAYDYYRKALNHVGEDLEMKVRIYTNMGSSDFAISKDSTLKYSTLGVDLAKKLYNSDTATFHTILLANLINRSESELQLKQYEESLRTLEELDKWNVLPISDSAMYTLSRSFLKINRGRAYSGLGQFDRAEAIFQSEEAGDLLQKDTAAWVFQKVMNGMMVSNMYEQQGLYEKSEKILLGIMADIEYLPKDKPEYYQSIGLYNMLLGLSYDRQHRYEEAERYKKAAVESAKQQIALQNTRKTRIDLAEQQYALGEFYISRNRSVEAMEAFLGAADTYATLWDEDSLTYGTKAAYCLRRVGETGQGIGAFAIADRAAERSLAFYERLARMDSSFVLQVVHRLGSLGRSAVLQQQYARADSLLNRAEHGYPQYSSSVTGDIWRTRSMMYTQQNRPGLALAARRRAAQYYEQGWAQDSADYFYLQGRYSLVEELFYHYDQQGQRDSADYFFQQAYALITRMEEDNPGNHTDAYARMLAMAASLAFNKEKNAEKTSEFLQKGLVVAQKIPDPALKHLRIASMYSDFSGLYVSIGQTQDAQRCLDSAELYLRYPIDSLYANDLRFVRRQNLNNRTVVAEQLRDWPQMQQLAEAILVLELESSPVCKDFAQCQKRIGVYHSLAFALRNQGKADEALQKALVARDLLQKVRDSDPPTVDWWLKDNAVRRAWYHGDLGQYPEALSARQEAVAIVRPYFEQDAAQYQVELAAQLFEAALAATDAEEYNLAEAAWAEALAIKEKFPDTSATYRLDLAQIQYMLGRLYFDYSNNKPVVLQYLEPAVRGFETTPRVADYKVNVGYLQHRAYYMLGATYRNLDSLRLAQGYAEKVFAFASKNHRENPTLLRDAHDLLGSICRAWQNYACAAEHFEYVLNDHKKNAEADPATLTNYLGVLDGVAGFYEMANDAATAETKRRELLRLLLEKTPAAPGQLLEYLCDGYVNFLDFFRRQHRYQEGEQLAQAALSAFERYAPAFKAQAAFNSARIHQALASLRRGRMYFDYDIRLKDPVMQALGQADAALQRTAAPEDPAVQKRATMLGNMRRDMEQVVEERFPVLAIEFFDAEKAEFGGDAAKLPTQQRVVALLDSLVGAFPQDTVARAYLADAWGGLSWYQIWQGKYAAAEQSALKGVETMPSRTWIWSNAALAKLLQPDKQKEALQLYERWKSEPYNFDPQRQMRAILLADLQALENAGLKQQKAFEKARQVLRR